ncbi:chemotaxis protein CheD [Halosimplex aquaticum]|uniref:Probable chemoreceptor glutamine deamidase CheD n=1 Tax=Halosimplex aquaticum TaxID=3026162 RepID=A0ABD5Y4M6_9EURY|nr:chemotaxis protein CheD [Halosimplex aquaticum]
MKVYDGTTAESEPVAEPERIKVGIAESKVTTGDAVLTTSGLGSCLGVAVYDERADVAGLLHVMLPSIDEMEGKNGAKFADSGIRELVTEMEGLGADRERMEAKIAGGSDMLDFSENGSGIGVRNVEQGRRTLEEFDIPVVGEDVGGDHGRSLRLDARTGDLIVKSANRDAITL